MARNKKKIVILGGGFAGCRMCQTIRINISKMIQKLRLVIVSEDNFLLFTPMLPQVASGMIETRHIVMPIRTILTKKAKFYEGRVKNIDPYGKIVNLMGKWR